MDEDQLTPAEQEELKRLEAELEPESTDLTPDEEEELRRLEAEFEPAEEPVQDRAATEPSMAESAVRGAAQGVTFGFAPEIAAAVERTLGYYGIKDKKTYAKALEESKALYEEAEKTNPGAFAAGEWAPLVASVLVNPAVAAGKVGVKSALNSKSAKVVRAVNQAVKDKAEDVIGTVATKLGLETETVRPFVEMAGKGLISAVVPGARSAMRATEALSVAKRGLSAVKGALGGGTKTAVKEAEKAAIKEAPAAAKATVDDLSEGLRITRERGKLSDVDDDLMSLIGKAQKAPAPTPSAKASNVLEARDAAAGEDAARRLADPSYASRASTWEKFKAKEAAREVKKEATPRVFDKERAKLDSELDAKEGRTLSILEQLRKKAPAPKKGR